MIKLTELQKKKRAKEVVKVLKEMYPDALCTLEYDSPWQLLEMTRLAAQCTDARVNIVSKDLFEKYKTPYEMANADVHDLEKLIYSTGFYRVKARDLKESSRLIHYKFGGKVPDNMDDLLSLPGVGRKVANLILGDVYNKPSIVTDTHCIRISNRLGLSDSKDPYKTEMQLKGIIDEKEQTNYCHRTVLFGREICHSQNPKCENCPFAKYECNK